MTNYHVNPQDGENPVEREYAGVEIDYAQEWL